MPTFRKGDRVTFTGEVIADLFGVIGVILKVRKGDGHYVYNIKVSVKLPVIDVLGVKLIGGSILKGVPSSWIELVR